MWSRSDPRPKVRVCGQEATQAREVLLWGQEATQARIARQVLFNEQEAREVLLWGQEAIQLLWGQDGQTRVIQLIWYKRFLETGIFPSSTS